MFIGRETNSGTLIGSDRDAVHHSCNSVDCVAARIRWDLHHRRICARAVGHRPRALRRRVAERSSHARIAERNRPESTHRHPDRAYLESGRRVKASSSGAVRIQGLRLLGGRFKPSWKGEVLERMSSAGTGVFHGHRECSRRNHGQRSQDRGSLARAVACPSCRRSTDGGLGRVEARGVDGFKCFKTQSVQDRPRSHSWCPTWTISSLN